MARDFSLELWLFTFGYLVEHVATGSLLYKIHKSGSMYGISSDMQYCLLAATMARVFWVMDTKLIELPLAWIELLTALVFHLYCCYLCHYVKEASQTQTKQKFMFTAPVVIALCFGISCIFHPGSKGVYFFTLQMFVSFTIFLEAASLMPQLWLLYHYQDPEGLTDWYLKLLCASRAIRFFFWAEMIMEGDTFYYLLLADFAHTVLVISFFYLYQKTAKSGPSLGMFDKRRD